MTAMPPKRQLRGHALAGELLEQNVASSRAKTATERSREHRARAKANPDPILYECPSDNNGCNLRRLPDSDRRIPMVEKCGKIPAPVPKVKVGGLHNALIWLILLSDGH
jgi:hypothetical protein